MLTNDQLRPAAIYASCVGALQLQHDKNFYVETILNNFQSIVHLLLSCSNQDILQRLRQVCEHVQPEHQMHLITLYFKTVYGDSVASALRMPPCPILLYNTTSPFGDASHN
jgi:hypothetical protein